jgi:twitching motility protein PilT
MTARKTNPEMPPWVAKAARELSSQKVKQVEIEVRIELPRDYTLYDLLRAVFEHGASDLHLSVGLPPVYRVHGELYRAHAEELTQEHAEHMLLPIITEDQAVKYSQCGTLDFAYSYGDWGRFRGNFFDHYRGMGAVFRVIPSAIPSLEDLGLPNVIRNIAALHAGFVLVTGPTGSGKSTTLAALINHINHHRNAHIITIEDPVEFIHPRVNCLIDHREIGHHAVSFADALTASLREDPDIILVGEMRDLDTIYNAIKAAETGILVFGTLHTNTAGKSVDRIIDVFPPRQQDQIRTMLAESLKAVVSQQLVRRADGTGRVAVHEILLWSMGLSNLIREGKSSQFANYIQMGRQVGMQSLDGSLRSLVDQGVITMEAALERAQDPANLENAV